MKLDVWGEVGCGGSGGNHAIKEVSTDELSRPRCGLPAEAEGVTVIESPSPPRDLPDDLAGFFWFHRRRFRNGMCFAFARILTIAPLPLIFQRIIDIHMPAKDLRAILLLSLLTVVLIFAHQFASVWGATRLGRGASEAMLALRGRLFEKIQFLGFGYLDRQKTGRLLSKYAFDTQKIEAVMMPILNGFIPNVFYSLVTFGVLVALNWQLSLVILLALPIFGVMRWRYFQRLRQRNEASRIAYEKMTGTAGEFFGALRLVRVYGEEAQAKAKLQESNDEVVRSRVQLITVSSSFNAFSFGAIQILTLVIVAGGAVLAIHGQISTGTVIAFVAGAPILVGPVQMFAHIAEQFFMGRESYRSVKELLDAPYVEGWEGKTCFPLKGGIEFDRVTFRYPEADKDALADFSLVIRPGEKVALVGPSGAGKSTVANLMMGLYRPVGGEIRIDGLRQAELDMRWLRRNTAIVMQESVLLSGTVAENLRFARVEATDEEVRKAAADAQAEEFIDRLPQGFETMIGERGVTLSGGQRQRLAIARAILRDPAILILDEPTSALDYESERLIQVALEKLSEGRTVITIAHRLSTIRSADRIVVLSDGGVVEQGSYRELAGRGGYFGKLLASQGMVFGS